MGLCSNASARDGEAGTRNTASVAAVLAREPGDLLRSFGRNQDRFSVNAEDRVWVDAQCTTQLQECWCKTQLTGRITEITNITDICATVWGAEDSPFIPDRSHDHPFALA